MAKNRVVAGDYKNNPVVAMGGMAAVSAGLLKGNININKDTVASYEVMNETQGKSAVSAVGRAGVGAVLLGPVGLAAGLSAKSKGTYMIAIEFKNGKKSLMEVDEKIYKAIMGSLF